MTKGVKKLLNISLTILLALGVGGCTLSATQGTSHKVNKANSAKIVKSTSQRNANKDSHQSKQATKQSSTATSSSSKQSATSNSQQKTESTSPSSISNSTNSATTNQQVAPASQQAAANTQATTQSSMAASDQAPVTTNAQGNQQQAATAANTKKELQLGLNDVAVWTDQYGITHHVNSDGLDKQTINGSSQVHYEDWSGSLPSNAQIIHNNNYNQDEIQLDLGDVAVWTDQYGITHHVNSDGLDKQTIAGSSQIHYQDWSGSLPKDAQVIHNN